MEKYLPIGSIVLLKNGSKRIMIYGRKQIQVGTQTEWDYIGCLYPEGNINEEYMYLFNHEQVDKVFHVGYQDKEEQEFLKSYLLNTEEQTEDNVNNEVKFL